MRTRDNIFDEVVKITESMTTDVEGLIGFTHLHNMIVNVEKHILDGIDPSKGGPLQFLSTLNQDLQIPINYLKGLDSSISKAEHDLFNGIADDIKKHKADKLKTDDVKQEITDFIKTIIITAFNSVIFLAKEITTLIEKAKDIDWSELEKELTNFEKNCNAHMDSCKTWGQGILDDILDNIGVSDEIKKSISIPDHNLPLSSLEREAYNSIVNDIPTIKEFLVPLVCLKDECHNFISADCPSWPAISFQSKPTINELKSTQSTNSLAKDLVIGYYLYLTTYISLLENDKIIISNMKDKLVNIKIMVTTPEGSTRQLNPEAERKFSKTLFMMAEYKYDYFLLVANTIKDVVADVGLDATDKFPWNN